jgi:hypothetical protein
MENKYLIKVSSQLEKVALNALVKRILAAPKGKFDEAALTRLSQPMKPDLLALKPTGSPRGLVGPMPAAPRALRTPETYHEGVIDAPKRAFDRHIQNLQNSGNTINVKYDKAKNNTIKEKVKAGLTPYSTTGNVTTTRKGFFGTGPIIGRHLNKVDIKAPAIDNKISRFVSNNHSMFDTKDKTRLTQGIILRHEGHEATEMISRTKNNQDLEQGQVVNDKRQRVGNHATLAVLGREQNDVHAFLGSKATAKVPYSEVKSKLEKATNSVKAKMIKMRTRNGESKILNQETGTIYGKDSMSNKYLDKLRDKPFNSKLEDGTPAHTPT